MGRGVTRLAASATAGSRTSRHSLDPWCDAADVLLRLRLLLRPALLFRVYGVADGVIDGLRAEDHHPLGSGHGGDVLVMQLRHLMWPRSEVHVLADRLGVSAGRLWAVGIVVKVSYLAGDMMSIESPHGAILEMRRFSGTSRPVCAVPNGLSGPVVAFT
jgi:hypothetical protein